jgi:flagellin-like hook-associated protein FlgL
MNKEQQEYFKNARDRFTTEVDSFLIAYDNAANTQNAALQKEVERLKWRLSEIVSCTKQSEVDGRNILNDNKSGTFHFAIKEAKEIITTK